MSEKISRRVFLKATGLAVLSVAAAGALEGCGSLLPLPSNVTLPSVSESDYRTVQGVKNTYDIAFTALSDQWESLSVYEKDDKPHRYIYAGLYIRQPNSDFTLLAANVRCSINGETAKTVAGLGNIALNKGSTSYVIPSKLEVSAGSTVGVPLYIDLGDYKLSNLTGAPIDLTLSSYGRTIKVHYTTPSDSQPTITIS